jgi:hypothetical protein
MKSYNYKGFRITEVVRQRAIYFRDKVETINCYGINIEYPKYKKNVMIDHFYINELVDNYYYYMRNLKSSAFSHIDLFLETNKDLFEVV